MTVPATAALPAMTLPAHDATGAKHDADPDAWRRQMEQAQMKDWLSHGVLNPPSPFTLPATSIVKPAEPVHAHPNKSSAAPSRAHAQEDREESPSADRKEPLGDPNAHDRQALPHLRSDTRPVAEMNNTAPHGGECASGAERTVSAVSEQHSTSSPSGGSQVQHLRPPTSEEGSGALRAPSDRDAMTETLPPSHEAATASAGHPLSTTDAAGGREPARAGLAATKEASPAANMNRSSPLALISAVLSQFGRVEISSSATAARSNSPERVPPLQVAPAVQNLSTLAAGASHLVQSATALASPLNATALSGPDGSEGADAGERTKAAAPVTRAGSNSSPAPEPIRLHADWSSEGVRIWLGMDATVQGQLPEIREQLQRWLASQGHRLLSIACNGTDITPDRDWRNERTDRTNKRGDLAEDTRANATRDITHRLNAKDRS